jgi:hypothetical protein
MKSKFMALGSVFALGAWLTVSSLTAQQSTAVPREVIKLAEARLEQALEVAGEPLHQRSMGMSSDDDISDATLQAPIRIRTIGYDALLDQQAEMKIDAFERGPSRVVVPIAVGDETRSWVDVVETTDGWSVAGFGDRVRARQATDTVRKHSEIHPEMIHAPAFQLYALQVTVGDQEHVVPIGPSTVPGLVPNIPIPAEQFLTTLAEYARQLDAEYGEQIRDKRLVN